MILKIEAYKKAEYEKDEKWSETHTDISRDDLPKIMEKWCIGITKADSKELKDLLYVLIVLETNNGMELYKEIFFRDEQTGIMVAPRQLFAGSIDYIINAPKMAMMMPPGMQGIDPSVLKQATGKSGIIL